MGQQELLPSNSSKLGSSGTSLRGDRDSSKRKSGLTASTFWRRAAIVLVAMGIFWVFWGLTRQIEEEIFGKASRFATQDELMRRTIEWTEHEQKVHRSRPHLAKVGRYSNEHRYRPAASPIIKETDRWGRVKEHGQYHHS